MVEGTNRPMKTRRSGMLFTVHTRSNRNLSASATCTALHCQTADPAELQHRYFFAHEKGNNESLRGPPRGGGMTTTIWRPRVRIDVPDVGDAENTDTSREELTKKGTKRKYAPRHYGPCELGVQGVQRLSARSSSALSLQGVRWVWNLRARPSALSMQGVRRGINLRARS